MAEHEKRVVELENGKFAIQAKNPFSEKDWILLDARFSTELAAKTYLADKTIKRVVENDR